MNIELLKKRLNELTSTIKYKQTYFEQYDVDRVEQLLKTYLDTHVQTNGYSNKRGGYIIECPGESTHSERNRRDDCTLYTTRKSNGFIFISLRCRHNSCSDALTEYARELNQEWGKYLNQHYSNI
jgi:hypothetical protein